MLPGKLSVSRTIGDKEAKLVKYGGNPQVVIPNPDVQSFDVGETSDFLLLGSDGIYDRLSSQEMVNCVWESLQMSPAATIHE